MKQLRMRRMLAVVVIAATLLCLLPASVLPAAAAAEVEGDWTVSRRANDYKDPDPITGEEHVYCPAPGYQYTSEGITTIPAGYANTTPFFNVQTKEKHSLKDGLYLQFRIDDFSYGGEDGTADHRIALSLWDRLGLGPGGGGNTTAQSCPGLIDTEEPTAESETVAETVGGNAVTEAPADTPEESETAEAEKGCGSALGMGTASALLLLLTSAALLRRKK